MPLLVNSGVVGAVLYILFFYRLVSPKVFKTSKYLISLIPIYYLLLVTMNGDVNVGFYFVFLVIVILYKFHFFRKQTKSTERCNL
jgi:hypothetical protein